TRSPVSENAAIWERLVQRLRARRDPPSGVRRPDEAAYETAIATAEFALDHTSAAAPALNSAGIVSDRELADRLARFIWNSSPDAPLLDAAQKGKLKDPIVLEAQVRRMLRDARSTGLITNFFERWMFADLLGKARGVDDSLRQTFETETRLFLE